MVDIKQDQTKKDPPPQQKGKPDDGKPWTGFDGLNFMQGVEKEGGGSQSGMGVVLHSSDGGGPDEGYLKKADPMAALLDMDKDGLDAMMSIAKTMPRGGGLGKGLQNAAEGADKLHEMDESGQKVSQKAVADVRQNANDQQNVGMRAEDMEPGKQYYCANCTTRTDSVILNTNSNSNAKAQHSGNLKPIN